MKTQFGETESQMAEVDPGTFKNLLDSIGAKPGLLVNRTREVTSDWWQPGLTDGWNYGVANTNMIGLGNGGVFFGIRREHGLLEARIEGAVNHSIDLNIPGSALGLAVTSRILFEGKPPSDDNALVFLVPFLRQDGSAHYLVIAFEIGDFLTFDQLVDRVRWELNKESVHFNEMQLTNVSSDYFAVSFSNMKPKNGANLRGWLAAHRTDHKKWEFQGEDELWNVHFDIANLDLVDTSIGPRSYSSGPDNEPSGTTVELESSAVPDRVARLVEQGWQSWQERHLAAAAEEFRQATQLDPENTNAWNGLGWAKENAGKFPEAETAFRRALALDPNYAASLNGLGQIYLAERKYDDAEKYLL